jgi:hypothetical protein
MINTSREEKLARFELLSKREGIMAGTEFALEYCGEHRSKPVQEPEAVRVNQLVAHPFFQDWQFFIVRRLREPGWFSLSPQSDQISQVFPLHESQFEVIPF